jgi:pimeloyl-ACP methyl ester carboxylesterase
MLTEKTFAMGSVSINYAEGPPSGKPLVMLHGVTTWWQTFLHVLPAFIIRHHTYALDLRGHGRSGRTPGSYLISHHAADVTAFLRDRVDEPAVLLGWSLGAFASLLVAAEAPELVRAVVLVDPRLAALTEEGASRTGRNEHYRALYDMLTTEGSANDKRSEMAANHPGFNEVQLRDRSKMLSLFDPEIFTFILEGRMLERYRLEELLPKIKCPVLLMQGNPELEGFGGVLADREAELAVSLLADCAHVQLMDAGHGIHLDQPAVFTQLVSSFLESL